MSSFYSCLLIFGWLNSYSRSDTALTSCNELNILPVTFDHGWYFVYLVNFDCISLYINKQTTILWFFFYCADTSNPITNPSVKVKIIMAVKFKVGDCTSSTAIINKNVISSTITSVIRELILDAGARFRAKICVDDSCTNVKVTVTGACLTSGGRRKRDVTDHVVNVEISNVT